MKKFLIFLVVLAAVIGGIVALVNNHKQAKQEAQATQHRNELTKAMAATISAATNAYNQDDYKTALQEFQKLIDKGYDDGIIWYQYAYSYQQVNGYDQQVGRAYEKAYTLLKTQYPNHKYTQILVARENQAQSNSNTSSGGSASATNSVEAAREKILNSPAGQVRSAGEAVRVLVDLRKSGVPRSAVLDMISLLKSAGAAQASDLLYENLDEVY